MQKIYTDLQMRKTDSVTLGIGKCNTFEGSKDMSF